MIKNTLIILHVLMIFLFVSYEFLFKNKSKYDKFYLLFAYFIIFHWTLLNGECLITYWYKLKDNKNYKPGSKSTNSELDEIFGKYKNIIGIIAFIIVNLNLYLICKRKNINMSYYNIFLLIFIFYMYFLYTTKDTQSKKYNSTNRFYTFILIIFGINFWENNNIQ